MTNEEIAARLEELAEILEISGENPFKVRAYQKAAQRIRLLDRSIADMVEEGCEKIKVPGIGERICAQIITLVKTGILPALEEAVKKVPPGIIELTRIPGVGPKTALILFEKLGVTNISELEKALKEGKLHQIKGIGSKTIAKIRNALSDRSIREERMLLPVADEISESVYLILKGEFPDSGFFICGSIRRRKETVHDIDIVVSGTDLRKVVDALSERGFAEEIIELGRERARIIGRNGVQIDFLYTDDERSGAALIHFTGSKEHNVILRSLAKKRGGKLTEEGYFQPSGKLKSFKTEEDFTISLICSTFRLNLGRGKEKLRRQKQERFLSWLKLKTLDQTCTSIRSGQTAQQR